MTLGLRPLQAGIIEMIPSLPIHTSVLIPLVAGLFLAALMLRAQRLPRQPLPQNGLTTRQARAARRRVQRGRRVRGTRTVNRGAQMSTTVRTEMKQNTNTDRAAASAPFRIHWGRTALALLGVLALIGGAATAVAVPFVAALSWLVPAVCAGVLLFSLAGLQITAAVRRRAARRQRVERVMQEAMNTHPDIAADAAQRQRSAAAAAAELGLGHHAQKDDGAQAPFDALSAEPGGKGGPDSLISVDEDGLPTSAERLFTASSPVSQAVIFDQSQASESAEVTPAESWNVREVPSAKYMVADKAQRPEPEPIEQEKPAPAGEVKLKQHDAGTPQSPEQSAEGARHESMDLDKVLQRRRA
ncbi:hypothetical protein [Nesterenkonia muleiensis]|uniref:hypothetical protein n=1 Tax=Nesterenkonia muleiensis TaxID=2282648 RepID=UPI000E7208A6|nr:hypothetical protein [Nesterenkonia muleiensis]